PRSSPSFTSKDTSLTAIRPPKALRAIRTESTAAEWIARALADQCGRLEAFQVTGAQFLRLRGRVEGVAEADQSADTPCPEQVVSHQRGDTATHRLATDEERFAAQGFHGLEIFRNECLRARRRLALAGAACGHVAKLEAGNAQTVDGQRP